MSRRHLVLVPLGMASFLLSFVLASTTACDPCGNYCDNFDGEIGLGSYAAESSTLSELVGVDVSATEVVVRLEGDQEVRYEITGPASYDDF